jgi:hypothetical protein
VPAYKGVQLKFRLALFTSLLSLSALAAACGSDEKSESEEHASTPAQAIERIANVRKGLDEAVGEYRDGDKKKADEIVGDTYLEEFEHVEGPLEKKNEELNEDLEHGIREELRAKIKSGVSPQEVETYVADLKTKLDQAEAALR